MINVYEKARSFFSEELSKEGDSWRILRLGTLVDLTKLSFLHFQKEKDSRYLIEIFNYSMKVKLLSRLKTIGNSRNLKAFSEEFNKEPEYILKEYDIIYNELKPGFSKYSAVTSYDLNNKIQYIKVVNELEIDSYSDEIFDEIISIVYNLLFAENIGS